MGNGALSLHSSKLLVQDPATVAASLTALPNGAGGGPDTPDMQPVYSVPPSGSSDFVIRNWRLAAGAWAMYRGSADALSTATAQSAWAYQNVTVAKEPAGVGCFAGPLLQGAVTQRDIPKVGAGVGRASRGAATSRNHPSACAVVVTSRSLCLCLSPLWLCLTPTPVPQVSTGTELLDQLANESARYIEIVGDVKVEADDVYRPVVER